MIFLLDTHCHTISSGHAYSTITEMAEAACEKGLQIIAMTDHGPAMPGGPHVFHFGNLRILPEYIKGVRVLKGVEANIMDFDGGLDLSERYLKHLEIVIASLHEVCTAPGSVEENTAALIGAMRNPFVDVIAHPGNPNYPIDIEKFVKCAKETNTFIEINNSSLNVKGSRKGSLENCKRIASVARDNGVPIVLGSDSHFSTDVGRFDKAELMFEEIGMPEELVVNVDPVRLVEYLRGKGREVHFVPRVGERV